MDQKAFTLLEVVTKIEVQRIVNIVKEQYHFIEELNEEFFCSENQNHQAASRLSSHELV
jgi:hypothetical protein